MSDYQPDGWHRTTQVPMMPPAIPPPPSYNPTELTKPANPPYDPVPQPRTRPRVIAAIVAASSFVAVVLVWRYFVTTAAGQTVDDLAFVGAQHGQAELWRVAGPVLDVVSATLLILGGLVAVVIAAIRRRWVLMGQVVLLIAGANVTTQVLKAMVFDRPHLIPGWTGANSLPSGHTTAAASVAAALVIAVPRRWRPAVALFGATWAGATGVSTLVGKWHRPSDVVAALLVVLAWSALMCAVTGRWSLDLPAGAEVDRARASIAVGMILLVVAAMSVTVAAVCLWSAQTGRGSLPAAPDVIAYAGGVLGSIGVAAGSFAVLLLLRQATARQRDQTPA